MIQTQTKWRRFPTHLMARGTVKEFIYGHAGAIGCDHTFVALPAFAMLGAAIGTRRYLQVKKGWREFPVIWSAIIGESGSKKSPAAKCALQPLVDAEDQQPPEIRYLVSDTTIEALVSAIEKNPQGLFVYRDELSGWYYAMNQYKGGRGADLSSWLSMHQAGKITVDRKTPQPCTIRIPAAAVGVTGSIQPGVLQRRLGQENFENGLAARFLYAQPPEAMTLWTENEIADDVAVSMETLVKRLLSLSELDGPQAITLDPDAKLRFVDFYNSTQRQKADVPPHLRSAFAKHEAYAARFALIFALAAWADGMSSTPPAAVDEESMSQAIAVVEWFKMETARVFSHLLQSETDRKQEAAYSIACKRGNAITASEVKQNATKGIFADANDAELTLRELVRRGLMTVEVTAVNGQGRQATLFRVRDR